MASRRSSGLNWRSFNAPSLCRIWSGCAALPSCQTATRPAAVPAASQVPRPADRDAHDLAIFRSGPMTRPQGPRGQNGARPENRCHASDAAFEPANGSQPAAIALGHGPGPSRDREDDCARQLIGRVPVVHWQSSRHGGLAPSGRKRRPFQPPPRPLRRPTGLGSCRAPSESAGSRPGRSAGTSGRNPSLVARRWQPLTARASVG